MANMKTDAQGVHIIPCSNLKDFKSKIHLFYEKYISRSRENPTIDTAKRSTLFRGQGNSEWPLETTLERYADRDSFFIEDYDHLIQKTFREVQSRTTKFERITLEKLESKLSSFENIDNTNAPSPMLLSCDIERINYMAYLRHHGFPSPLLDWTRSPYIALFFAFRGINTGNKRVSIYAYQSFDFDGAKISSSSNKNHHPTIFNVGPHLQTSPRHFNQQAEYTLCRGTKKVDSTSKGFYASYSQVDEINDHQDYINKYTLPMSEREDILKELDSMNINAFTLLGTEDSLMETLAFRYFT